MAVEEVSIWQEFGSWIAAAVATLVTIISFLVKRFISAMDLRIDKLEGTAKEQGELIDELDKQIELNSQADEFFRKNITEDIDEIKVSTKENNTLLSKLYTKIQLIEQRTK